MRIVLSSIALLILAAAPAGAQRIQDFGFGAGLSVHPSTSASPQLAATMTLGIRGHDLELAAGSSSDDAFFSASYVRSFWQFHYGAGIAAYDGLSGTKPGLAAHIGFALPIAPRSAAALEVGARGIAVTDAVRLSLGAGIRLAPRRGGLLLGERVEQPMEQDELARSWEVIVGQIMLFGDGGSSLEHVTATDSTIEMRFAPVARAVLMDDVARVARILAASTERVQIVINAPEAMWVRAAATSGGFPTERITEGPASSITTIHASRRPDESASRSEQP
jgi:hypothetical protein